jgi:hypothetical protein
MPASLRPPNGGRPAPSASEPQGQWRAPPPPGERRPPPHPVNIEPRADHPDFAPPPVAPAPPPPPPPPERHPLADYGSLEPQIQPENLWSLPLDNAAQQTEAEPPHRRPPSPPEDTDETAGHRLPRRSRAAMLRTAIVLLAVAAFAGLAYWQRAPISNVFGELQSMVFSSNTAQRQAAAPARPKITDRLGQPSPQISGAAAQRVVLYEEDPEDPQGKRFTGTVLWRTEVKSVTPGRSPETVLRADIDIPDRKMGVTWTLRRNTDPSLPASHTIEIVFNMPPDTPTGGVYKVPGVLMKQSEQTRGVPLAGVAAEMPPAYFLIGLSSVETDVGRNIQLLKERSWFDIPIVYKNNRRAILAMEKGGPGEQAFSQAFASWKQ